MAEPPDTETRPTASSPPGPEPVSTERLFVRLTFWQTVLSVVGVFIAVVALYAALKESAAVRQQTAAAVWPFVQLMVENSVSEEAAHFAITFTNVGVGPAKLKAVKLVIDGEGVHTWQDAVARVGGDPTDNVSRNFVSGRVLRPEETVVMLGTTDRHLAEQFQSALSRSGNHIVYCYCSIFEDCWLADSRLDLQDPEPVASCPDFGDAILHI